MNMNAIRVGVVGCGAISSVYLDTMIRHFSDVLEVRLCSSAHMNSAQAQSERYGITAVSTEELLACPDIDLVVNLTPVPAHEAIIRKALEGGKHVYSEKTLTESLKQSAQLLALAEKRGRLLCCAPDTMLSAGVQTARRALQEGMIGQVTSAEMNMNRDYGAFYPRLPFLLQPGAGCGMDIGPYFISCAVYLLGPVAEVAGFSDVSRPCREGGLKIQNENRFMAALRFRSGCPAPAATRSCGGAPVWQKWRGRCWRDVRPCWTPDLPTIRRRSFKQFMTAARRDGISACAAICRGIVRRR